MAKIKYYFPNQRRTSGTIKYVFFGIIIFILVFFPFYGLNLRYQLGVVFSEIFSKIGMLCLFGGGIMLLFSFIGIFTSRSVQTKYMIVGILLLWVGCWSTGIVLDIFGFTIGNSTSSSGNGWH